MRVLIVTQVYWPENFRINDVAAGLVERGHDVVVLTGLPNYPSGKVFPGYGGWHRWSEEHDGACIKRVPLVPRGKAGGMRLAVNYASFVVFASLLWPFRLQGKFDAMLVFEPSPVTVGLPASLIRFFKRVPMAFWVQDLWPESLEATGAIRSPRVLSAVASLVRFIYSNCDLILVQSRAFIPRVEALGVSRERIEYLPNSAEDFYRIVDREDCEAEDLELGPGLRIMFAGNLGVAQDLPTILAAAELTRHRSDLTWIIVGDGRERPWLETEVRQRGLAQTVKLLGPRPATQMPRYFAVADALLVTLRRSAIFELTIPSKVQSYLACGRPVIAALDGEGARLLEEARAGLVCPTESPQDLAEVALRFAEMSPEDRARLGRNGRTYFEGNFERADLLGKLESHLQRISNGNPA